jgi:phage tail sheath protein FI
MAQLKFGSPGVSATEIDQSQPLATQPTGTPAGVVGTSLKGPAFVPVTVAVVNDFYLKYGLTDGKKFGPLAVTEWLRNAQALTYLRVLGCGDGTARLGSPANQNYPGSSGVGGPGDVNWAGFTVGEQEPSPFAGQFGQLSSNPYANMTGSGQGQWGNGAGPLGRTYFLGCFMSESLGSTIFSSAGIQKQSTTGSCVPIVRGVVMAASGVIMTLSSSIPGTNNLIKTPSLVVATNTTGSAMGDLVLFNGSIARQDFVLYLNGLTGGNPLFPNVITASFDMTSPNYFANVLNTDPDNLQQAGHYLYSHYDINPATAVVTGSGLVNALFGAGSTPLQGERFGNGIEPSAFILTSPLARDVGNSNVPDYEDFRDRFEHALSPWVVSQPFGGRVHNLFRVHALDDGTGVSVIYKLSIENPSLSTDPSDQYGTFDLVVRQWGDNDGSPVYLEQFRGLSLDPSDSQYVAAVIGDVNSYFDFDRGPTAQKLVVDGNYPNGSNYIRIEVDPSVDAGVLDPTALPVGMRGVGHLVTAGTLVQPSNPAITGSVQLLSSSSDNWTSYLVEPPLPLRLNVTQGSGAKLQVNPLLYWGVQFEHITNLATPNLSTLPNQSLQAFAGFYPEQRTDIQDMRIGNNPGTPNGVSGSILDSDIFNFNAFSLMNILVVTNSAGVADPTQWASAQYIRNGANGGNIPVNTVAATRGLLPSDFIQSNRRFVKWSFLVQGGFDGTNLFDPDARQLTSNAVEDDMNATNRGLNNGASVSAYTVGVNIMGDVTNVDIELLAVPGIRQHFVTDAALAACEARFDCMYLMDIEQFDNNDELITDVDSQLPSVTYTVQSFLERAVNSSFGAAYFPDVVMPDPNTKTNVVVAPSVVVLGALALNDAVGHPWFAPAGFTRGALQTTLEAKVQLSKANMDVLSDANINPLVAFPGNATGGTNPKGGVVVWGQKTLQQAASALDRVNVRRLLIEIRRQVRDIALNILFEQNRDTTLAAFSSAVTPVLQKIQAQAGLERFKVVIDTSTTTQQDIENNTIRGKIFVQPTKSIEYVSLDFVVTNNIAQQT